MSFELVLVFEPAAESSSCDQEHEWVDESSSSPAHSLLSSGGKTMAYRYFGIDIHKAFVVIAAVNDEQEVVQPPRRILMAELLQWAEQTLKPQDRAVIEATTNAWHIYDILDAHAGEVLVANPYKTKLIAEARIKSDKLDALTLARLLAARFICEVWVPVADIRQRRSLANHRTTLSRQMSIIKNRVHMLLARHDLRCPGRSPFTTEGRVWLQGVALSRMERLELGHLLSQLDLLATQRAETDQLIAQLAAKDDRVSRLMQMTGIGFFTAFATLAIIGDIHRFPSPGHLTSYAGLVPSLHQSGNRAYTGHITKAGSSELRWLMVETARSAIRFDPYWQRVSERIKRRRGANIAAVAVARKLLVVIWHLLHNRTTYYHLRPQSFVRKLQDWAWCIGQESLSADTSADFVRQQLKVIGLPDLAVGLTTNCKGKLIVEEGKGPYPPRTGVAAFSA